MHIVFFFYISVRIIDKNFGILIYFALEAAFANKNLPLQVLFLGPLTLHYVDGVFRIYLGMYNVPEPCLLTIFPKSWGLCIFINFTL